jgi:hypothetical protein
MNTLNTRIVTYGTSQVPDRSTPVKKYSKENDVSRERSANRPRTAIGTGNRNKYMKHTQSSKGKFLWR